MNKRKFGIIGEKIARDYLRGKGYEILETNFYTRRGEIDIVAEINNIIVFVEVKTRTNFRYGTPAMSVNSTKKKHIRSAAQYYIYSNKLNLYNVRFDVVEIYIANGKCEINQIEGIM